MYMYSHIPPYTHTLEKKKKVKMKIKTIYYIMVDNDMPGAWPVGTPGAQLVGFIKRTAIHCYIQNMKGLGLVVWEKKIFFCFSHEAPGAGPV